jgi:3-hydroxyisobutyrate dehydrogenase
VGVVGLGQIGDGVAGSLVRAGFDVVVADVRSEATATYEGRATVAGSPAELARSCDVVVVAVVDDDQVRSVLSGPEGALAAARDGAVVVVVSTVTADCIRSVGAEAARHGVAMVDCGVSGGPTAAQQGDLILMVGGDPAVIERLDPVLGAIGSLTVVMGPLGAGLAAKLARNLITYASWLAAYEGQVLAQASGIDLAKLAQVVKASDVRIGGASALMFRRTAGPLSPEEEGLRQPMAAGAALAHKDLEAALAHAAGLGVDLPLAAMTEARIDDVFGLGTPGPDVEG